jgi:hypothetical protein
MEQFTLDEAQRWIGRSVIAKTDWHAGSAQMAAEQQGTVIGVQGEHTSRRGAHPVPGGAVVAGAAR